MKKYKYILHEYLLYFLIILIAYSIPPFFSGLFLIGVFLYGIFIQKNLVRWFFLFLIISNSPGYLFSFADANYDLMKLGIGITAERGVFFQEIFMLFMFVSAITDAGSFRSVFKRMYVIIIIYISIVFILTASDLSGFKTLRTIRMLIPHLAYFFIPVVFKSKDDYIRLLVLLLPFPIFIFFVQIFELSIQQTLVELLGSSLDGGSGVGIPGKLARQNYSQIVLLFCLMSGFFLLGSFDKIKTVYSRRFIYFVIGIINLSIFFSATRGYFIASVTGTILYLFSVFRPSNIFRISIYFLISLGFIFITPFGRKQVVGANQRISTIETIIVEKDLTAGGTSGRIDYAKDILEKVADSPVYGYGFSQIFWTNANVHSGFATNLLNGGALGLLIILFYWFTFFKKTTFKSNCNSKNNQKQLALLSICLFTYIIVHFTSNYIFSFVHLSQADGRIIIIALIYSFASQIIIEDRRVEVQYL